MKKLIIIGMVTLFTLNFAWAQEEAPYGYYIDAARFSRTMSTGSARIQGIGGTNIALGADASSIYSNPAGLGLFNRSEFTFTPSLNFINTNSKLNGFSRSTFDNNLKVDQLGVVFNRSNGRTSGWLGGSFGISVNKINDFNRTFRYSGSNSSNSIVDFFIESANGFTTSQFPSLSNAADLTTLSYYSYLIGPMNVIGPGLANDQYFSDITSFLRPTVQQQETVVTSGSQYQWSFSYGANYNDFLYIGASLGFTNLNYHVSNSYSESGFDYSSQDATYNPISSISFNEDLFINGTGVNGTFGLIVRPQTNFRLGFSLTTPTLYNLNDRYLADLTADWNNFLYQDIIDGDTTLNNVFTQSAIVTSRYRLRTPLKLAIGGAFFVGNRGFISLDAEYLDYGSMKLSSSELAMDADNTFISNNFTGSLNLRLGGEMRAGKMKFRAGYALNNIPTNKAIDYSSASHSISGGFGISFDPFVLDLALTHVSQGSDYSPYNLVDNSQPNVRNQTNDWNAALTFGYKF